MSDRSRDAVRRQNERRKKRSRDEREQIADIGTIPPVRNPARRAACERKLLKFLTTYFPATTGLKPFSPDHIEAIGRIETCALEGGLFEQLFPRGFAKTTISENSVIWVLLYGHRKFAALFGADANAASGNIDSIKLELSENDLLAEDFPEVIHAIRALEGKPQRCHSQVHAAGNADGWKGKPKDPRLTHIEWRGDTLVLPTIMVPERWGSEKGPKARAKLVPSKASGAIVTTRGLMGGSRGMKHKRADGTQQRPDFILIDDPQTDESASTALQVGKREAVIRKNILRLGGHGRRLAVVMNATTIRKGDLTQRIAALPSWQFKRIQMVRKWAKTHETLWLGDYRRLRETYDPNTIGDQQRAHREATEFYRRNRAAMDEGAEVAWEHCYDESTELSAVQHAYNILIDDGEEVFASECQNDPVEEKESGQEDGLGWEVLSGKLNGLPRGVLPAEAQRLVIHIDVQKALLPWVAVAVGEGFGGAVVDYGTFPDQRRARWSLRDARRTIATELKVTGDVERIIYAGLEALVGQLMSREWKRDGVVFKPERILVDANWGEHTDVVYQFCRESPYSAVLLPAHGQFRGATSKPFNEYAPKPGDRVGIGWRVPVPTNRRSGRYVLFDTNFWKNFLAARLRTPMGGRGCFAIFGKNTQEHALLFDHLAAETPVRVEAKGRTVVEWKVRQKGEDNHWFDNLVGCCVAAAERGARLDELKGHAPKTKRERVKLSEIQRGRSNG